MALVGRGGDERPVEPREGRREVGWWSDARSGQRRAGLRGRRDASRRRRPPQGAAAAGHAGADIDLVRVHDDVHRLFALERLRVGPGAPVGSAPERAASLARRHRPQAVQARCERAHAVTVERDHALRTVTVGPPERGAGAVDVHRVDVTAVRRQRIDRSSLGPGGGATHAVTLEAQQLGAALRRAQGSIGDAVEDSQGRDPADEPGRRRVIVDDTPRPAAVIGALQPCAPGRGRGVQTALGRRERVDVEHLAGRQRGPLPARAVGHHVFATARREARVLEGPVEEPAGHRGSAGVLAEEVSLVPGSTAPRIVRIHVGGVVIDELHAVDQPQPLAVTHEPRDGVPRTRLDEPHQRLRGARDRRQQRGADGERGGGLDRVTHGRMVAGMPLLTPCPRWRCSRCPPARPDLGAASCSHAAPYPLGRAGRRMGGDSEGPWIHLASPLAGSHNAAQRSGEVEPEGEPR